MSPVSESTEKRKDDAAGRLGGTADIQRKIWERDIERKKGRKERSRMRFKQGKKYTLMDEKHK